jgi:FMN phosphatase YigB (HAD superfamily)
MREDQRAVIRAHSFDVFDTLLVRTRAEPADILHAAADAVVPSGAAAREQLVAEVARRRRDAEFEAIAETGADAVGVDAIYARLEDLARLGVDPAALRAAELGIEDAEVRPVRAGRERVEAARAKGRRVIFVSDMYLPASHIRAALERFEIARPDDPLYVSGMLGTSKRSGRLFDHVLREEGLSANELVHTGDDPVTDAASPRARGIAIEPLTAGRLDRLERRVLKLSAAPRDVRARLVGAIRAARVASAGEGSDAQIASLGASVGGPLFAGFVAWVLRAARREGVERLFFVARDAQVFLRVAEVLAQPGDPELRYLHGSRQAWLLAGVESVDRASLAWVAEPEWAPPRALLAKLDIAAEDVAGDLEAAGLNPDEHIAGERREAFWGLLEKLAPAIEERARSARALASEYLEQEGLGDGRRWALVDVGWRLTAQSALRRILPAGGGREAVNGFYLGASRLRAALPDSGPFQAFVTENDDPAGAETIDAWLWRSASFVEQVLAMADHGSCSGYRRDGQRVVPVLRAMPEDARRDAVRSVLRTAIVGCAAELRDAGLLEESIPDVRAAALAAGHAAVHHPTADEAAALGWFPITDDQNETRTREFAPSLTVADLWRRSRERLGLPVTRDFETVSRWPEGSYARTPPVTRAVVRGLRAGRRLLPRRSGLP